MSRNSKTNSTISTDIITSSPAGVTSEPSFSASPSSAQRLAAPHQPSNYDGLHYDATGYHQLQQRLLVAFDPIPSYATTTHALEQSSTSSFHDFSNGLQSDDSSSQVEAIHGLKPCTNNFCPICESSYSAPKNLMGVLGLKDTNAQFLSSIYPGPTPESFETEHGRCISRHIPSTNKTFCVSAGYSSTAHTYERTRTLPKNSTAVENYAFFFNDQTTWVGTRQTDVATTYSGTLEVHVGSDTLSDAENNSPHLLVEHAIERPQLVAWIHQKSTKAMTLSEKLEMNKHTWLE